jgi:hypothetical protein
MYDSGSALSSRIYNVDAAWDLAQDKQPILKSSNFLPHTLARPVVDLLRFHS